MAESSADIDRLLHGTSPSIRATYDAIVAELASIGPFTEEVRQSSIHFAHSVTFASVQVLPDSLTLTLRTDQQIKHARIDRNEHVSENRWQVELSLSNPAEVDHQVRDWLTAAMELT
jgi:hypothetical protein